jgi:hypothetical protein
MGHYCLSMDEVQKAIETDPDATALAESYWLSWFYESAVFNAGYTAPETVCDAVRLTNLGNQARDACMRDLQTALAETTLAVFGHFFHHELLVDHAATNVVSVQSVLEDDLLKDRIRFPYIWGRVLHDRFIDHPPSRDSERLTNLQAWELLENTPIGVYQHGTFISGPLGITRSAEVRWIPLAPVFLDCHVRKGTQTVQQRIPFDPARIKVVEAYSWIDQWLYREFGTPSPWSHALSWVSNRQRIEPRTDYVDICPVIAECIFDQERTALLESALKTDAAKALRETIKNVASLRGFNALPPHELAKKLDSEQQLQLLLSLPTAQIVACIDTSVLSGQISVPVSELRVPKKSPPHKNTCFSSEISSLGLRVGHAEPFALLCSSILRAYDRTEAKSELAWRLQSDPSRGIEVMLTDFIRHEGPAESVSKLVLASQPVSAEVCRDVQFPLTETFPRTETTVPRILWKFGFEIARYDDSLSRLNRWLQQFEDALSQVDFSDGEKARENIRAQGVNLFVAVEEFLDQLIAFNVWLLASDHWAATRFQYRVSDARRAVPETLGKQIESSDGTMIWKTDGENTLGTQLAYLNEFEMWLDSLGDAKKDRRAEVEIENSLDYANRPFPFLHTKLWADSDSTELRRYREMFKRVSKSISQADVAGVRNGIDHQREESRFPSEEKLWTCVTRLKSAVRSSEQTRIYPVAYWFDSRVEKAFGTSENLFKNSRGETFNIFRPSTIDGLPRITRTHPVVFAPVNFLGAADAMLFFQVTGESRYATYWAGYPRVWRALPEFDENKAKETNGLDDTAADPSVQSCSLPCQFDAAIGSVE